MTLRTIAPACAAGCLVSEEQKSHLGAAACFAWVSREPTEFRRYAEERRAKRGEGPPETFDFLGFTHISGKARRGDFTIHRKTARKKFLAKLAALKAKLKRKVPPTWNKPGPGCKV